MELQELIEILEKHPRDKKLKKGLGNPHSWRGAYSQLAFEIVENTTVGEMLDAAISADGATYGGWKGGEYDMDGSTDIHIEIEEGDYSDNSTLMRWFFELLLAD